ncbi:ribonuclease T2 family protein [Rhizobium rhizoryzae]|uniref:Ribonuclease T2 n=1 Tax=Rhizobium rhizoryzae TaxID=451876 RepID=A0A7W6LE87_9HYPH|nr:ribonuclease [Rhizobium rhizoryzae]MBB4142562.1 ribonuclease T2 [Rhizobium rhizoryzae]
MFRSIFSKLIALTALAASTFAIAPQTRAEDKAGAFDFYVLALSWSPTFCSGERGQKSPQQCGTDKKFSFIVHGLWPQNESGYPQSCASSEPRTVPDAVGRPYFDIMPSMGLIGHQWRKHGTCTGLSQKDYLEKIRSAYNKIKLPQDLTSLTTAGTFSAEVIEQKFTEINPGLTADSIAVNCEASKFEEVRICMTKDLGFRPCTQVDRGGCKIKRITVPPAQ